VATDVFRLVIKDVFVISPRAIVVTGRVTGASVGINDRVEITGGGRVSQAEVVGVEVYRKMLDLAGVDDDAGLMLRGPREEDIQVGFVVTHAPASPAPGR